MADEKKWKVGVVHPSPGGDKDKPQSGCLPADVVYGYRYLHPDIEVFSVTSPFYKISPAGLQEMSEKTLDAVTFFRERQHVDLVIFYCTAGSLIGGADYDKKMGQALQAAAGSRSATTTTTCVLEALRAVHAKRLTVVTPYPDDVNIKEKEYLEREGFIVDKIAGMQYVDPEPVSRIPPAQIYEFARASWAGSSDALFISSTGLNALPIIEDLEKALGAPVITSSQASLWGIGTFFGAHSEQSRRLGQLFLK